MNQLLTTNAILVSLLTAMVGKTLTTIIPKEKVKLRKALVPFLLCVFGIGMMCLICYMNHQTNYGDAIINGLVASVFSQFIYDRIHDNFKKRDK